MMSHLNSFVIAHIDDDPLELKRFSRLLKKDQTLDTQNDTFALHSFLHSKEFIKFLSQNIKIDFCLLDIMLSHEDDTDGLSLIHVIKSYHPECVIIISSWNDTSHWILKALSLQADDFFSKKLWPNNICERLKQVYHTTQIKNGRLNLNQFACTQNPTTPNIGYSKCVGNTLKSIENRVQSILKSAVQCVLIEGESGTGKEVVVDIFEYYSKSQCAKQSFTQPFVRLNCASLAQNLLESELFGHKKGAFTGALQDNIGFIEAAHNGFLFLDEISSLSAAAQAALLRVIENQEVIRLGETKSRKINVKFIFASNISLSNLVKKSIFRKDLWQRIREVEIILPPLYKRKDEIPEMIDFFCREFKATPYLIDSLAKQLLSTFDWRDGNVRELRNTLRAMTEFAQNGILSVGSIPNRLFTDPTLTQCSDDRISDPHFHQEIKISLYDQKTKNMRPYSELCDELLKEVIKCHSQQTKKLNASKLAKSLRIARSTLHAKIKEFRA